MSAYFAKYDYLSAEGADLFTVTLLPDQEGQYPTVIRRSPYVDRYEKISEEDIMEELLTTQADWLANGYAVVFQHCRGRGKSSGDFIPYINERADGLFLQEWIRQQPFYNGELFLVGTSYTTTVHYVTAPFAKDIKGAIFGVQDSERYNICYRNGFLKKALHSSWYVGNYKKKTMPHKPYATTRAFNMLPLSEFTKTVFGELVESFDDVLKAPKKTDPFWQTHSGGTDTRGATDCVHFPILFTTGFYDIYTGGVFDMWNAMSPESKSRSALVVSPYNHGDSYDPDRSLAFENGKREEAFGAYGIAWLNYIRGKQKESPFKLGKVTYYRLFDRKWQTEDFPSDIETMQLTLGKEAVTYLYNPYDAPGFQGGLSCNFGGTVFQNPPNSRSDILSIYTEPFAKDTFVKGKMSASLRVASDCEDTGFYVRVSLEKEQGDYGLRDDITSLVYQLGDYTPGSQVDLKFTFDEHAFLIQKGERLRIDIASADDEHYVNHTNQKGLYSEQTMAKVARNTVYLQESKLMLPVEQTERE